MLCLSSGRKAPFLGFSACQQSCIILRLTKCQTAAPGERRAQRRAGAAGERAVIEHPHSDTDERFPLFTAV